MTAELKQLIGALQHEHLVYPSDLRRWTGNVWALTDAGHELLEILRREAALQRIAAAGARYTTRCCPMLEPLEVWFWGELGTAFGNPGDTLTADLAEAGAAWAEAQAQPKAATCARCGKRCAP